MRTAIFTLLMLATGGCSPTQRAAVGAGVGGAGLLVSYSAIRSMVPSCRQRTEPQQGCIEGDTTPPSVGFSVAAGGLGVAVLGGLIVATAGHSERSQAIAPAPLAAPEPPKEPPVLDEDKAVGLAAARLALGSIDGKSKPATLLGVDDTRSSLHVEGRHAELWNLLVRTAADETWRRVDACYELDTEWRLTSVGTTPGCAHARGRL